MRVSTHRASSARLALVLCLLGGTAQAQLDLPRGRRPAVGPAPRELVEPPARGDLAPREEGEDPRALQLPERPPVRRAGVESPPAGPRFADALASLGPEPGVEALERVGRELSRVGALEDPALEEALGGTRAVPLRLAVEVLLQMPEQAGIPAVVERLLAARFPASAAEPVLGRLREVAPATVDDRLLVRLLGSRSAPVRSAAVRILEERLGPGTLPALVAALGEPVARTRSLALDLVRRVPGGSATNILLASLADPDAAVARAAAEELALRSDATIPAALRTLAFRPDQPLDRAGAYALLALADREDRSGEVWTYSSDVQPLLEGLRSPWPLQAGACAVALAGIGMRAEAGLATPWLDREVPHTLVRTATGDTFFSDFASVRGPGLRRLSLLTGEALGESGAAWQAWWAEHAEGFRARRAVLPIAPGQEQRLEVTLVSGGTVLRLVGRELAARFETDPEPPLFLDAAQARALAGQLQATGVFGAERPPAAPGARRDERLELAVDEASKVLLRPAAGDAGWFDEAARVVRAIARPLRLQRWYDRDRYGSAFEAWVLEHERESRLTARERDTLLAERVLKRMQDSPEDRAAGAALLEDLYAGGTSLPATSFATLVSLLGTEARWGTDDSAARRLARLAADLVGAGAAGGDEQADARRLVLLETLAGSFGADALETMADVLSGGGPELLERVAARAGDEGAPLRAAAARALARSPTGVSPERARAALLRLLDDDARLVRLEAVRAAGSAGIVAAEGRLVALAGGPPTEPDPAVRGAALEALARLGAPRTQELALLALPESHPALEASLAEALATLAQRAVEAGTPEEGPASVLASIFARGPDSPGFPGARRGLFALGDAASADLGRLLRHPRREVQREAALLASEEGRAEAAPVLLTLLTQDPKDERVARELAVLTCYEPPEDGDRVAAWWQWWDGVRHDDAGDWFAAAAARASRPLPARATGEGSRERALVLLGLAWDAGVPESLSERARRELDRVLGRPAGGVTDDRASPGRSEARDRAAVEERFPPR